MREGALRGVQGISLPVLFVLGCGAAEVGCSTVDTHRCDGDSYPTAPEGATRLLHVSAACPAEGADGSKEHAYPTIGAALKNAPSATAVLIASGSYHEHLMITQGGVQLVGSSDPTAAEAAGAEIAPPEEPVAGCDGRQSLAAVTVCNAEDVTLRGLRVTGAVVAAVMVSGSSVRLEGCNVENTAADRGAFGHGVIVAHAADLIMQTSTVVGSAGIGVLVSGASAMILQSTIRENAAGGVRLDSAAGQTVLDAVTIERNTGYGIGVFGSQAIVLRSTIVETRPDPEGTGDGIVASGQTSSTGNDVAPSSIELVESEISSNSRSGVLLAANTPTIIAQRNTIARNALGALFGAGLWIQGGAGADPSSRITENNITENRFVGIGVSGETSVLILRNQIVGTVVKAVVLGTVLAEIGDGAGLYHRASAIFQGNTVRGNDRFGLLLHDADGSRTVIRENTFEMNDKAIVMQDQVRVPDTSDNTFDAPNSVEAVPAGTYGAP